MKGLDGEKRGIHLEKLRKSQQHCIPIGQGRNPFEPRLSCTGFQLLAYTQHAVPLSQQRRVGRCRNKTSLRFRTCQILQTPQVALQTVGQYPYQLKLPRIPVVLLLKNLRTFSEALHITITFLGLASPRVVAFAVTIAQKEVTAMYLAKYQ